jgi:hypothetical protein
MKITGIGGIDRCAYHKVTLEEIAIRKEIMSLLDNSEELSGLTYDEAILVSEQLFDLIIRCGSNAVIVSKQLEQERINNTIRKLAKKLDERDAQKK